MLVKKILNFFSHIFFRYRTHFGYNFFAIEMKLCTSTRWKKILFTWKFFWVKTALNNFLIIWMFQGFWPQDHNICRAAFSEQQPSHVNLCRFLVNIQCFYHLSKLKAIKLTLRPRMPHPHPHPLRDKPRMLDLSVNF